MVIPKQLRFCRRREDQRRDHERGLREDRSKHCCHRQHYRYQRSHRRCSKGDIDVQGPVILDSSAIVMGNIKSKSVQINNGAVIEGMCSQCYAEVSPTSFFDDYKPEKKKTK